MGLEHQYAGEASHPVDVGQPGCGVGADHLRSIYVRSSADQATITARSRLPSRCSCHTGLLLPKCKSSSELGGQ